MASLPLLPTKPPFPLIVPPPPQNALSVSSVGALAVSSLDVSLDVGVNDDLDVNDEIILLKQKVHRLEHIIDRLLELGISDD